MSNPAGPIHLFNKPGPAWRLVLQEIPSWYEYQTFSTICLLGYHHSSHTLTAVGDPSTESHHRFFPNSWCSGGHRAHHLVPPTVLIDGLPQERSSTVIYVLMWALNQGFKLHDASCTLRTRSSTKRERQTTFVDDAILYSFIQFRLSWLSATESRKWKFFLHITMAGHLHRHRNKVKWSRCS